MRVRQSGLVAAMAALALVATGCAALWPQAPSGPLGSPAPSGPSVTDRGIRIEEYYNATPPTLADAVGSSRRGDGYPAVSVIQVLPGSVRYGAQPATPVPFDPPGASPTEPVEMYTPNPVPWNVVTAQVEEVFSGDLRPGDQVEIASWGGIVDGVLWSTQGQPALFDYLGKHIVLAVRHGLFPDTEDVPFPSSMFYPVDLGESLWLRHGAGDAAVLSLASCPDQSNDVSEACAWASITVRELKRAIADPASAAGRLAAPRPTADDVPVSQSAPPTRTAGDAPTTLSSSAPTFLTSAP